MTTHTDTDGNGYRWDEQLRQWVPAYGDISPAEMAADQAFRSHDRRSAPLPDKRKGSIT